MYRFYLRNASPLFLSIKQNSCFLTRSNLSAFCKSPRVTNSSSFHWQRCRAGTRNYLLTKTIYSHKHNYGHKAVFSMASVGIMSFLGFSMKTNEEEEDELIMTIKRSVLAIQRGEMKKAEQMLHLALRIAQQKQSEEGITYIYDLLANVALENGEYAKSEKLFVNVMQRLLQSGVPQDDNKIIHISLKLAELYVHQGDKPEFIAKAREGFRFSIDALEKKISSGDKNEDTILLLSLASEGDGMVLAQLGQLQAAHGQLRRALDLSEQSGADSEDRQATLASDLGAVCSMMGDQDAALTHLQKAVDLGRKADAENLPAFLVNYGLLNLVKGMKSEAKQACNEAWKISKSKRNKEAEKEAVSCLDEIKKA